MEYPIKITDKGESLLTLRQDEVRQSSLGTLIEIADALERKFWEMSNNELYEVKNDVNKFKSKKLRLNLIYTVDKILAQRKFLQDNQALRNALIPE